MFSVQDWVAETGGLPDRSYVFAGLAEALSAQVAAWATSAASGQSKPAR
jgi:hypothetical protein